MPTYNKVERATLIAEAIIRSLERQLQQTKLLLRQLAMDHHYACHFGYFADCGDPRCVEIRTLTECLVDEPEPHE